MVIGSRLKASYDGRTEADPEQLLLMDQFEDHGKDVIEYVVPELVATMRSMPRSVQSEIIPTMAGMVIAAGTGLSPSRWRKQYGDWTQDEMNPLEATAFLLAEHINRLTDDHDHATRLITNALSRADQD